MASLACNMSVSINVSFFNWTALLYQPKDFIQELAIYYLIEKLKFNTIHNYMQSLYGAFIKAGNHEGATFQKFNLLHPYFSIHLLHTVLYTFPKELPRRICLTIKTSWPICLIQGWYSKEKWDSSHSSGLKG